MALIVATGIGLTAGSARGLLDLVVAGHRRFLAAQRAGLVVVPADVYPTKAAALEAVKHAENRFREEMSAAEEKVVDTLGRLGMIARGITFTLVGWFVIQGGLQRDASKVHGYGGAFLFLLGEPFGRVMLGVVAVGFIALGLHSFACARWVRLMGSTS